MGGVCESVERRNESSAGDKLTANDCAGAIAAFDGGYCMGGELCLLYWRDREIVSFLADVHESEARGGRTAQAELDRDLTSARVHGSTGPRPLLLPTLNRTADSAQAHPFLHLNPYFLLFLAVVMVS
jgi:hypothetical protein